MSQTHEKIKDLALRGLVLVSEHGLEQLLDDDIPTISVVSSLSNSILLEDYPDYHKGPSILLLQVLPDGSIVHVVWGLPKGKETPAVIVTAYRPDPKKWSGDFKRRLK